MTRWTAGALVVIVLCLGALFWWFSSWPTNPSTPVAETSGPPPAPGRSEAPAPPEPAPQTAPPLSAPASAPSPPAPASASAPPTSASPSESGSEPPSSASAAKPNSAPPSPASSSAAETAAPAAPGGNAGASNGQANRGAEPGAQGAAAALGQSVVHFGSGSTNVPAGAADVLKRLAEEIKRLPPGERVQVAGYTDNSGNAAANVALSQKRAEAVREALIGNGVNPDRLVAKGYGSADPLANNDTPRGRDLNRRIEFQVVQGTDRTAAGSPRH